LIQPANSQPSFINHLENQDPELARLLKKGNFFEVEQFLAHLIAENKRRKREIH
jgi:hypothetical protein